MSQFSRLASVECGLNEWASPHRLAVGLLYGPRSYFTARAALLDVIVPYRVLSPRQPSQLVVFRARIVSSFCSTDSNDMVENVVPMQSCVDDACNTARQHCSRCNVCSHPSRKANYWYRCISIGDLLSVRVLLGGMYLVLSWSNNRMSSTTSPKWSVGCPWYGFLVAPLPPSVLRHGAAV